MKNLIVLAFALLLAGCADAVLPAVFFGGGAAGVAGCWIAGELENPC